MEPHCGWPSEWEVLPCIDNEYALERLQWGDKAGALIQIPAQLAASFPELLLTSYIRAQQADNNSPSVRANQKISVAVLACLSFDSTEEQLPCTRKEIIVLVRGGIQASVISSLWWSVKVTTLFLSGKASTICQTLKSQVASYRDSNLCWLPFTVKKAPEWYIPRMTKHLTFASPKNHYCC